MSDELENKALKLLAKQFEYNQALHMESEDMAKLLGVSKKEIQPILRALAKKQFANVYEEREQIKLAKISWQGLNEVGEVNLRFGMGKDAYANYKKEGIE